MLRDCQIQIQYPGRLPRLRGPNLNQWWSWSCIPSRHTHKHIYTEHMYVWLATRNNTNRNLQHKHKQHRWHHPVPLSEWSQWRSVSGKYVHVQNVLAGHRHTDPPVIASGSPGLPSCWHVDVCGGCSPTPAAGTGCLTVRVHTCAHSGSFQKLGLDIQSIW